MAHIKPHVEEKHISQKLDYKNTRTKHLALNKLIEESDKKLELINNPKELPELNLKKRIHVYLNLDAIKFLEDESQTQESKWNLRKNTGLGDLVAKFIGKYKIDPGTRR